MICVITAEEVGRLKNYKLPPICDAHKHIPTMKAIARLHEGSAQLIEDGDKQYITMRRLRVLQVVKSGIGGKVGVVQLVIGTPPISVTSPEEPLMTFEQEQVACNKPPKKQRRAKPEEMAPVTYYVRNGRRDYGKK